MLVQDKANKLTDFLNEDYSRTKELLEMEPADALKIINAAGLDFTEEELQDYSVAIKAYVSQGELSEENLDEVSGGIGVVTACCLIVGGSFVGGVAVGVAVNAKW